jgi:hypothetical protein
MSVYLYLICVCSENLKIENFKFQSPESSPTLRTFQTQGLEVSIKLHAALNIPAQNPKIVLNVEHFDRIIKQNIILVKTFFIKN